MKDLAWQAEAAANAAWPALLQIPVGDWSLRIAPGISRRANSLNPLHADAGDVAGTIAASEPLFGQHDLPMLFRIPTFLSPHVDRELETLNFSAEGETKTLYAALAATDAAPCAGVDCAPRADSAWFAAMHRLQGHDPRKSDAYRRVVGAIAVPVVFLRLHEDDEPVALAYGALHGGLVCCESVVTATPYRGRGYARRIMRALLAWAGEKGAEGVCLQVEADNRPALALYRSLGLVTELYSYHYRRRPHERRQAHRMICDA